MNGTHGIYAHSTSNGESVANIVSNAQNTVYLNNSQPIPYPQGITLIDNQNNLFDALRENIRFVLGGTQRVNTILYNDTNNTICPNQMRPSYKNLQIYREGIFPLLSGWYAPSYNQCTDQFSGTLENISGELPNSESIPVNHSLQEVEFISSSRFLNYLNLRQFVAISMAWAITEDVVNDYINGGGNASCMKRSMYLLDNPDDNNSSSSGISSGLTHIGYNSPILMPFEFINREIIGLLNKIGVPPAVTFKEFSPSMVEKHPILIIPTGLLIQYENDSVFKIKLEQYVKNGGTVIVLAQQYGSHYEKVVPLPEGSSLSALGWREDQSCFWGAAYHATQNNVPHPIFSGVASETVSVGVDGYFSTIPANATVLLRRKVNQEPVMISYPVGQGMVILTSLFSDYANAHSQMSGVDEAHIIRDLLTYSRNVNLPIPSWRLTRDQAMPISLPAITIHNDGEVAATRAKFQVLSPDYKRVLYTAEQAVAIDPQADGSAALSFSITPTGLYNDIISQWIGIYHMEVELYDASGNLIQPFTESDGGRFAIHWLQGKYNPGQGVLRWLTVHQEDLYLNQNVELDVHFRNTSDQSKTIAISEPFLNIGHGGDGPTLYLDTPINIEIPAGEERIFHASMPMSRMGSRPPEKNGSSPITMRLQYVEAGVLRQIGAAKVVFLKAQATSSLLAIQGTTNIFKNGTAIDYSITANNNGGAAYGLTKIRLMVDRYVNKSYQELATVYEIEHDFTSGNAFQYNGQFIPSQLYAPGTYRMRLAVSTSDSSVETKTQQFNYVKSNVALTLATIPEAYTIEKNSERYGLIPGQTYSVNFRLRNLSPFTINQGRYVVTLKSEGGIELFRKEVANITFNVSQELAFSEPFVFSPVAETRYNLRVEYSDESRTAVLVTIAEQQYQYLLDLQGGSDQLGYRYLDIANFQLKIAAVGAIHIKLSDITTGAVQERDIVIPKEQAEAIETFKIPIGYPTSNEYEIDYEIRDSANIIKKGVTHLLCLFPKFKYAAQTDSVDLKQGPPLNLQLAFSEISGVKIPFNAVLSVKSASLNYDDTRTVTIQPGINNEFNYQVPVTETVTEGSHTIEYQLLVEDRQLVKSTVTVKLPMITLKFFEPPANVGAGTPFDLKFENSGGKPGTFNVFVRLFDEFKKQVLEQQSVLALAASEQKNMTITLPVGTKSGRYILLQEGRHESSGQVFKLSSHVVVSGMTATLNAFTLKEKYFDNEAVAGKAEIGVAGEVANGMLRVKILKNKFVAQSVYEAGDFSLYRRAIVSGGGARANKTYLISKNKLFAWDYITNKYIKLLPGENFISLFIGSNGDLWLTTSNDGVWHLSSSGVLINHFTTADGLLNNNVSNFSERDKDGWQDIWMATSSGISVFSNGALSSYTTADGLSSNNVFDFARDGAGEIWVWSAGGIDRFNGSRFDKLDLPFDPATALNFGEDASGSIWMTTGGKIWRYTLGEWNNWDVATLFPGTLVNQFAEDDGQMWFLGTKTGSGKILLKCDGDFTLFSRQNLSAIGNITCIIPCPEREGILFGANPGFVEFSSGKWQLRQLEIDMDKLLSPVTCITGDTRGRVWIGSIEGVSCLDKGVLNHYFLGGVSALTAGTNGVVYAAGYSLNRIKRIEETVVSNIEYPTLGGNTYRLNPVMGFDTNGRLWYSAGIKESTFDRWLFCYDGVSAWIRAFPSEALKIVSDGAGSIWGGFAYSAYLVPAIFHINNDFSVTRYQGVYLRPKDYQYYFEGFRDIFLDSTGVLWIIRNGYDPTVEALQTFQNDIFTLKAVYSPGMITRRIPGQYCSQYRY
ncbi:MAG: hypothetical protein NTW95_01290 [Candidatus Aminicenantes bacterium]|nr:hypothetical protein [Candidatus Aminicenantes bacterium]